MTTHSIGHGAGASSTENDDLSYIYSTSRGDGLVEVDDNLSGLTLDHYTYDGAGNQTGTGLGTPNTLNQYSALTYNGRGDVTGDGTYTFGYDANDRLISIAPVALSTGSVQLEYGYDGQGRRLWKDVYSYSTTTSSWTLQYSRHYLWNGDNLVAELDGNNNLVTGYTWGPNGLLAVTDYTVSPAKTYVAVNDASGNLVELVDAVAGTVAASFHYDPYGNLLSSSGPAKNVGGFRGKGEYVDAEVPTIRHALYRDDEKGIWLERDPSGESGGLNLYEQYGNDPINNIDPSGLRFETLKAIWAGMTPVLHPKETVAAVGWAAQQIEQSAVQHVVDAARDPEAARIGSDLGFTNAAAKMVTGVPALINAPSVAEKALDVEIADAISGAPDRPESSYLSDAQAWDPLSGLAAVPDQLRESVFQSQIQAYTAAGYDPQALRAGAGVGEFEFNVGSVALSFIDPLAGAAEGLDFVAEARLAGATVETAADSTGQRIALGTLLADGRIAGVGPSAAFGLDPTFEDASIVDAAARHVQFAADEAVETGELSLRTPQQVAPTTIEQHHIFPQGMEDWFGDPLNVEPGFNIHDHVVDLPDWYHDALHAGGGPGKGGGWYNETADSIFRTYRATADGPLTHEDVLDIGLEIRRLFKIDRLPVHPYNEP